MASSPDHERAVHRSGYTRKLRGGLRLDACAAIPIAFDGERELIPREPMPSRKHDLGWRLLCRNRKGGIQAPGTRKQLGHRFHEPACNLHHGLEDVFDGRLDANGMHVDKWQRAHAPHHGAIGPRKKGPKLKAMRAVFDTTSPALATTLRRALTSLVFIACVTVGMIAHDSPLGWALAGPAVVAAFLAILVLLRAGETEVGTDGITIDWLGRKHFIRHQDIKWLEPIRKEMVRIHLQDGRTIPIAFATPVRQSRDELIRLADKARGALRTKEEAPFRTQLARNGRALEAWTSDLERLASEELNYRTSAPPQVEELWRVVENPNEPEDARAAAALLLKDRDRPRLRLAAEAVASPKLRVALEAVAESEADPTPEEAARVLRTFDRA